MLNKLITIEFCMLSVLSVSGDFDYFPMQGKERYTVVQITPHLRTSTLHFFQLDPAYLGMTTSIYNTIAQCFTIAYHILTAVSIAVCFSPQAMYRTRWERRLLSNVGCNRSELKCNNTDVNSDTSYRGFALWKTCCQLSIFHNSRHAMWHYITL